MTIKENITNRLDERLALSRQIHQENIERGADVNLNNQALLSDIRLNQKAQSFIKSISNESLSHAERVMANSFSHVGFINAIGGNFFKLTDTQNEERHKADFELRKDFRTMVREETDLSLDLLSRSI